MIGPRPVKLMRYDAACKALAEAHRVDEVKNIRDKAVAVQAYARQAKDATLITQATEIRMRAERRAGKLLIEMAEKGERAVRKNMKSQPATSKLADLGINKTQSSRWQALAALDQDRFEAKVEGASKRAYDRITHRFLKQAEIERAQARHSQIVEHGCTVDDLIALADSGYRASVIYADIAWPWQIWGGASGKIHSAADNHYNTSTIEQIMKLPVAKLAADNCALLSWCTWPHITIGSHVPVIQAWGFKPSTDAFVWVKTNADGNGLHTGMGYWTRSNTEACFIATKGSPTRLATDVHQVVFAPVGEHSAKPEEVRRRIERLFAGPYLELYGRKPVPGWTVWGNEIRRDRLLAEVDQMKTRPVDEAERVQL
jgi:Transcriptional activator, adenine-specific DNA methyltransferase